MHYKNGERAAVGHLVIAEQYNGQSIIGQVASVVPGSTTCNLNVLPLVIVFGIERDAPVVTSTVYGHTTPVTASQALRIDLRPRTLRPEDDFEKQSAAYLATSAPA